MNIQKLGKKSFSIWFDNETKSITFNANKKEWSPRLSIRSNGAKKKNKEDVCYDLTIIIGTFVFSYTNWDLQKKLKGE